MRLLILGDLHARVKAPARRKDVDFRETVLGKVRQVLDIAARYHCDCIVQAGDFFHSPDPSKELVADLIELLRGHGEPDLFAIHGQHDLSYHSEAARNRSALRVLEAAEGLTILRSKPRRIVRNKVDVTSAIDPKTVYLTSGDVNLYGADFGQDPPVPEDAEAYNVLVAHTMVGDKSLYPGQELTGPAEYANKHPGYALYIFGDYHYPYTQHVGSALCVNAGCLLRLTAAERDRLNRPKVVLVDTETQEAEDVFLDVAPWEEVFDLTGMDEEVQDREAIEKFIQAMQESGKVHVSFRENLETYYAQHKTPQAIREIVEGAFGIIKQGEE